jgi:hypothetical protein
MKTWVLGRLLFNHTKILRLVAICAATITLVGCEALQQLNAPSTSGSRPGSPKLSPDYDTPENSFVAADFNKLGSEFLDDYANQYVVFNANYQLHQAGALIGRALHGDMMTALFTSPSSGKRAEAVWHVDDRELGRPFLELKQGARVKIYGYVLPSGKNWSFKTRRDEFGVALKEPVLLLIKAVPQ